MNKYQQRLLDEWIQYGKIIIAVDYDDTLAPWRLNSKEELKPLWELLKQCKYTGAYVTIFTACDNSRYPEILEYCKLMDFTPDSINQNPISLPYGNQNKVYANIFIDDRAGMNEAIQTLEFCLYKYRGWKIKQNLTEQNID